EALGGGVGPFASQDFKLSAIIRVVIDKELLDLIQQRLIQVGNRLDVRMSMAGFGDGQQAVIAFGLAVFCLFSLNHADQSGVHQTSGKRRLVHQDQHIERVSVLGLSRWNESEIVWK